MNLLYMTCSFVVKCRNIWHQPLWQACKVLHPWALFHEIKVCVISWFWLIFKSTMQGRFLWLLLSLDVAMLPFSPTMCGALEMRVHWSSVQQHCHHHQPATIRPQWSVLSVRETAPPSLSAALEIFVLLVERGRVRAEWRSVWEGSGGLYVTVGGTKKRHWWCAGREGLGQEVRMFITW